MGEVLSLLRFTKDIWNSPSFDGVVVIAVQHVLESTYNLFCLLVASGLNPKNTFILGKCYSTSSEVFRDFQKKGFQISEKSLSYHSHRAFDDLFEEITHDFLNKTIKKINFQSTKKIIVLDDGGHLLHNISKLPIPIPVVGIEQTSAGYNHLLKKGCNIPILNVARSKAKLTLESPIIVRSCLKRLNKHESLKSLKSKNVLILGCGSIGKELKRVLNHAHIFDVISNSSNDYFSFIKQADVIFGCSGSTSLPYRYYPLLKKGVTLVSLSSSDREFEAHLFRREFPKTHQVHANFNNNTINLLQSGFPINFWGSRNNIPLKHIQITLALLQAGIYEAIELETQKHGILTIDTESESLIMQEYRRLFRVSDSHEIKHLDTIAAIQ